MINIENETLDRLLSDLKITESIENKPLLSIADFHSKYLKDLRINVTNALSYKNLTKKESYLIGFSVAVNEKNSILINSFSTLAKEEGATSEELAEVISCVSLMNTNNIFYRFRHYTKKETYQTPAGIKMSIMVNPLMGKDMFELISLCISALNGCEMCVNSHENSVLNHGVSEQKVFDAIRLTAIIKGLSVTVN